MAKKVNKGDYVVWSTTKGKYTGRVSSVATSGSHRVSVYEGTETVEASINEPVATIRVFIDNEDGTFTQSDRSAKVQFAMLQIVGEPETTKSVGETINKRTDFPKRGDDQKVSIANSKWKTFPKGEAAKLKAEWPQIWRRGGNILGNKQYSRLLKVMNQGGSPKTPTDEKAIRLREAWVARHFKDFRLAGVVAQIKWLAVGSRGLPFMRKVISDEKKRLRDRKKSGLDEEE